MPHTLQTEPTGWGFDGNLAAPTFSPSVLVTMKSDSGADHPQHGARCHSYVRAGRIEFLTDSTHALAGKTVDLPEWPTAWD